MEAGQAERGTNTELHDGVHAGSQGRLPVAERQRFHTEDEIRRQATETLRRKHSPDGQGAQEQLGSQSALSHPVVFLPSDTAREDTGQYRETVKTKSIPS